MGYYTRYTLTVTDKDGNNKTGEMSEYVNSQVGYENLFDWDGDMNCDPIKWYNYDKDMINISKNFEDHVFKIEGVGEEHPDIWVAYFKNGLSYREKAVITLPSFDETKLS